MQQNSLRVAIFAIYPAWLMSGELSWIDVVLAVGVTRPEHVGLVSSRGRLAVLIASLAGIRT